MNEHKNKGYSVGLNLILTVTSISLEYMKSNGMEEADSFAEGIVTALYEFVDYVENELSSEGQTIN